MLAFLHFFGRYVYKQEDSAFLSVFLKLRLKMKIGYECWRQQKLFSQIVLRAIKKTVKEKLILATHGIQKFINDEDVVSQMSKSLSKPSKF